MNEPLIWLGIALCLTRSATFFALDLAVFSLSRLQLESAAELTLLAGWRRIARPVAADAAASPA